MNKIGNLIKTSKLAACSAICIASLCSFGVQAQEVQNFDGNQQNYSNSNNATNNSVQNVATSAPEVMCKNKNLISAGVALLTGGIGAVLVDRGLKDSCTSGKVEPVRNNTQNALEVQQVQGEGHTYNESPTYAKGARKPGVVAVGDTKRQRNVNNSNPGRTVSMPNVAQEQLTVLSDTPNVQVMTKQPESHSNVGQGSNIGESIGAGVQNVSSGLASFGKGVAGALSDIGSKLKERHQQQANNETPRVNEGFSPN